jgi:hypothetical protein
VLCSNNTRCGGSHPFTGSRGRWHFFGEFSGLSVTLTHQSLNTPHDLSRTYSDCKRSRKSASQRCVRPSRGSLACSSSSLARSQNVHLNRNPKSERHPPCTCSVGCVRRVSSEYFALLLCIISRSLAIRRALCDPACEPVRAQASRREHTVDVCCALALLGVWQPSIHWQPCDLRGLPSAEFSGIVCDLLNFRLPLTPRILESETAMQRCVRASGGSRECTRLQPELSCAQSDRGPKSERHPPCTCSVGCVHNPSMSTVERCNGHSNGWWAFEQNRASFASSLSIQSHRSSHCEQDRRRAARRRHLSSRFQVVTTSHGGQDRRQHATKFLLPNHGRDHARSRVHG